MLRIKQLELSKTRNQPITTQESESLSEHSQFVVEALLLVGTVASVDLASNGLDESQSLKHPSNGNYIL